MEPFNPNEHLLERILSKENMATAWKRVKANQGAPGVDGISIEQFPDHTRPLWAEIRAIAFSRHVSTLAGQDGWRYPKQPGELVPWVSRPFSTG